MTDRSILWRLGCAALAVIACALLFSMPARAERADRDKPMNIEADQMRYDDLKQVNVFTGNVTITKGTIVLKADRVEVHQDPEGYQYATAYAAPGKLAFMKQKRDGLDEYIEGWGEQIDYNGKTQIATLTRRAVLKRLAGAKVMDEVHGSVITYDTYNEVYTAVGGKDQVSENNPGGRVRATLAPKTASAPGAAAPSGAGTALKPSNSLGNPRE
ncbi:lipopolysaccharide transport periplasmic protein LptA [Pandoraea sp.]|uniref:lipopolysaccharide transport periplasmic protein LptA n=1 Tax=Pandoraea sp. TaxID=1883445 RepID=UPI001209F0AC|nr:lipopolysaccharide transport periplasmic protein LptA [Pandoraea sp.]MBU6492893.1 lipopolysaccharide transport periplasmic protein LptA [Burkholderiales bacterium]MDE2287814.1 lipopolysaccharide transport periplasmic protein LptA [Burkholderiales bacterium]MDE2611497.1 lipopolysaccharide transport periplasmic protein LptA [Burkholderiales bacterium]TAL54194.1 MAG: lipopolysaccharide transport periplasmic protein LptA [Pandoraea sp.]TAM15837.1 MAG: lipopolysaccharide transport periplasmic pr